MVEIDINEQGGIDLLVDKWDMAISLLAMGFSIALVVIIITASVRAGWRFWPWVLALGFIAWMAL